MTRVEQVLVGAFSARASLSKAELLEAAEALEGKPLVREALRSLTAKGVLLSDDWGVISINRNRAQQVLNQPQLYEPLLGE